MLGGPVIFTEGAEYLYKRNIWPKEIHNDQKHTNDHKDTK